MADQKITQLTELTTVASEDLLAVVDDPSGTPMTKKATISNLVGGLKATGAEVDTGTEDAKIVTPKAIADSKLSYTDGAETLSNKTLTAPQINDTTADHQYIFGVSELTADRTVTLPLLTGNDEFVFKDHTQTLTNKTLTSPLFNGTVDGWISANETWTYASADDPTYTFTVAADVTTKYSAGMRIKLKQTTVKYFIITGVSTYSGGNTTITVYGGTDYDLDNATISNPYYSTQKVPQGFPLSPLKWSVELVNTTNPESTIAQNTWSNLGSVSVTLPIGVFDVNFSVTGLYCYLNGTSTYAKVTLSTANNSESDADFTLVSGVDGATASTISAGVNGFARKYLSITTKTVYYINFTQIKTGSNPVGCSRRIIRATCAYL